MTIAPALLEFVNKDLLGNRSPAIDERTSLLSNGTIDSIGLTEILAFIERATGVKVPDEEIAPANFDSVAAIAHMVERLEREARR
jgi:acyl carrier protein